MKMAEGNIAVRNTLIESIIIFFCILFCLQSEILETIQKVSVPRNPLNEVTSMVLTTAFAVGKGMMPLTKHTIIMDLLQRFKAYEGNERCKNEKTANSMILSIGSTIHSKLINELKKAQFPVSLSFDGSDGSYHSIVNF